MGFSRGALFSGRPIRHPTLTGAECSHRIRDSCLTCVSIPSTAWSSSNICACKYSSGLSGPGSGNLLAASLPILSVSAIPRPRCLAPVSAAMRTVERSLSNAPFLFFSFARTVSASLKALIL